MTHTGILIIDMGESRLDETLLGIQGENNPLDAATLFLENRGFKTTNRIRVTGGDIEPLGNRGVIYITGAEHAPAPVVTTVTETDAVEVTGGRSIEEPARGVEDGTKKAIFAAAAFLVGFFIARALITRRPATKLLGSPDARRGNEAIKKSALEEVHTPSKKRV